MSLKLSYLQEVEAKLSEAKPANRATEGWDLKKYNLYYVYCIALLDCWIIIQFYIIYIFLETIDHIDSYTKLAHTKLDFNIDFYSAPTVTG